MNAATNLNYYNALAKESVNHNVTPPHILKFSVKNERKILKAFLLNRLHQLFFELFQNKMQFIENNYLMECYAMDSKIIQLIIQNIIESGKYTLEGIAFYTRIPFDVIYDAACGISNESSITLWVRVVDLFIQVNPDVAQILIDKLLETKNNFSVFSLLLDEMKK